MWCGRVGADGLEPFSLRLFLLVLHHSSPLREDAGHTCPVPLPARNDHHDSRLMSVLLLTVAVAAWSLREKSRCMIPGSLANFRYFYPLNSITPANISDPLLHLAGTFCLRFVAHMANI